MNSLCAEISCSTQYALTLLLKSRTAPAAPVFFKSSSLHKWKDVMLKLEFCMVWENRYSNFALLYYLAVSICGYSQKLQPILSSLKNTYAHNVRRVAIEDTRYLIDEEFSAITTKCSSFPCTSMSSLSH
jgi:hypothetical protein